MFSLLHAVGECFSFVKSSESVTVDFVFRLSPQKGGVLVVVPKINRNVAPPLCAEMDVAEISDSFVKARPQQQKIPYFRKSTSAYILT